MTSPAFRAALVPCRKPCSPRAFVHSLNGSGREAGVGMDEPIFGGLGGDCKDRASFQPIGRLPSPPTSLDFPGPGGAWRPPAGCDVGWTKRAGSSVPPDCSTNHWRRGESKLGVPKRYAKPRPRLRFPGGKLQGAVEHVYVVRRVALRPDGVAGRHEDERAPCSERKPHSQARTQRRSPQVVLAWHWTQRPFLDRAPCQLGKDAHIGEGRPNGSTNRESQADVEEAIGCPIQTVRSALPAAFEPSCDGQPAR